MEEEEEEEEEEVIDLSDEKEESEEEDTGGEGLFQLHHQSAFDRSAAPIGILPPAQRPEASCFATFALPSSKYVPGLWAAPLPTATVVRYPDLPPRPEGATGSCPRGWVPPGFDWAPVGVGTGGGGDDGGTGCEECGVGSGVRGNELLLCDNDECGRCYHMACLTPQLKRLPRKAQVRASTYICVCMYIVR